MKQIKTETFLGAYCPPETKVITLAIRAALLAGSEVDYYFTTPDQPSWSYGDSIEEW